VLSHLRFRQLAALGDLIFGKVALEEVCSLSAFENEATELNPG